MWVPKNNDCSEAIFLEKKLKLDSFCIIFIVQKCKKKRLSALTDFF